MEVYTTENEQVDAVRRFFAENGKALAIGVVLGIAALGGWRFWQSHQDSALTEASASFQKANQSMTGNNAQGVASLEKFAQSNDNNYGVFAALQLADHFVETKDFANAEKQLVQAQGQAKEDNLRSLVNLRLARIQMQQGIRGDVLLAKGDAKGAREAYSKGLDSKPSQTLQTMLRMKLNNLAS